MNSTNSSDENSADPDDDHLVVAEIVEVVHENVAVQVPPTVTELPVAYEPVVVATVVEKPSKLLKPNLNFPRLENLASKGGAVAAIVLGMLAFAGSFVTSYSIINSVMGGTLGVWGLRSSHKKMATIGIILCLISAFFCIVEISDWLQSIWPAEEETY